MADVAAAVEPPGRRAVTLSAVADAIEGLCGSVPVVRVGIDGVDGAGKTVFGDELGDVLTGRGWRVVRASVDGFHHPPDVRYRQGRHSPEGFFEDSYDYAALRRLLLDPLSAPGPRQIVRRIHDVHAEAAVEPVVEQAGDVDVLVFDGIFVHRPELRDVWDYSVFLDVDFDVSIPRGAARGHGDPDPTAASNRRYVAGQRLYLRQCHPRRLASCVVDNTVLEDAHVVDLPRVEPRDDVVQLARPEDVDALLDLRDRLARWLTRRGVDQWTPGELPAEWLAAWVDQQAIHVLRRDGRLVAAVAVIWDDPEVWGHDDGTAGYVHLLMVDRADAGRGLGERMLAHAEQQIARAGRTLARLDAVTANPFLDVWYRARGYRPVGTRVFPDPRWHDTTLYEKPLR